jgi:proliferating cell nuclear antigen PCNA
MSKYEIIDLDKFRNGLKAISELIAEPNIELTADGWKLVAMDPANVAMVSWVFKSYTSLDHKDMKICFNLAEFRKMLARGGKEDHLTIEVSNKIEVLFKGKTTKKFSLPLIESEANEQKVPELEFKSVMTMPSKDFSATLEDAGIVGESIALASEESGNLVVVSEGDLNKFHTSLTVGIEKIAGAKGKYSLEYLNKMKSAEKLSDNVLIKLSSDYPLMLVYGDLTWILAPRVDSE